MIVDKCLVMHIPYKGIRNVFTKQVVDRNDLLRSSRMNARSEREERRMMAYKSTMILNGQGAKDRKVKDHSVYL